MIPEALGVDGEIGFCGHVNHPIRLSKSLRNHASGQAILGPCGFVQFHSRVE
jgi:hypothetical protein